MGEPRSLTGPEPGLTRDAVRGSLSSVPGLPGVSMELVDTAGWVGRTRTPSFDDVGGAVADLALRETRRALASCHVALLVVDAERGLRAQRTLSQRELALAGEALQVRAVRTPSRLLFLCEAGGLKGCRCRSVLEVSVSQALGGR
eukprot:71475-Chlamydomonas_euryale.AAC.1